MGECVKKIVCVFLSLVILAAVFTGCGKKEDSNVKKGDAKAFTHVLRFEDDGIEFCVPEEHSGNTFSDLGVN